jgi:hypothetical protein
MHIFTANIVDVTRYMGHQPKIVDVVLAVIKCIYLPPAYLHFMQDIEDMCLLLMSSMGFVDLLF